MFYVLRAPCRCAFDLPMRQAAQPGGQHASWSYQKHPLTANAAAHEPVCMAGCDLLEVEVEAETLAESAFGFERKHDQPAAAADAASTPAELEPAPGFKQGQPTPAAVQESPAAAAASTPAEIEPASGFTQGQPTPAAVQESPAAAATATAAEIEPAPGCEQGQPTATAAIQESPTAAAASTPAVLEPASGFEQGQPIPAEVQESPVAAAASTPAELEPASGFEQGQPTLAEVQESPVAAAASIPAEPGCEHIQPTPAAVQESPAAAPTATAAEIESAPGCEQGQPTAAMQESPTAAAASTPAELEPASGCERNSLASPGEVNTVTLRQIRSVAMGIHAALRASAVAESSMTLISHSETPTLTDELPELVPVCAYAGGVQVIQFYGLFQPFACRHASTQPGRRHTQPPRHKRRPTTASVSRTPTMIRPSSRTATTASCARP